MDKLQIIVLSKDPLFTSRVVDVLHAIRTEPILYDSKIFNTPEEVLKHLGHAKSDALLLDVSVIVGDPAPLLGFIRAVSQRVAVILVVNEADDPLFPKARMAGVQDILIRSQITEEALKKSIVYAKECHHHVYSFQTVDQIRFVDIIQKSTDGMMVLSEEGRVIFANPAVEKIFGKTLTEIVDLPFDFQMVTRNFESAPMMSSQSLSLRYVKLLAKTEKTSEVEIDCGEDFPRLVEVRATEITWKTTRGILVVFHDITALMKLQKLKSEIFEHEKVSRLKDEFLSTVSHELRTPLAIVKCAVENMKDGVTGPMSEKQTRVVQIAAANVERLSKLIDDILDLSKLESGKAQLRTTHVSLAGLITDSSRRFSILARDRNLEIETDFFGDDFDAEVDADKILQVLDNLISNGLKYAHGTVRVSVRKFDPETADEGTFPDVSNIEDFCMQGPGVWVTVMDDGPGIPVDKVDKLFQKFMQIDRPMGGAGYKGTGLGLAICKEIVELHSGKIWVERQPLTGAYFHFILPCVQPIVEDEMDRTVSLGNI